MMFLDPEKPLATCGSDSCGDCTLKKSLHCHFQLKDWIYFLLIALPPFLIGGAGIYAKKGWLLVPWITFVIAFFGFVEIRVMCSLCPHYAESLTTLKCWANYGSPKLWRYRPGPMTQIEKTILFGGFAVVWGYPLVCLTFGRQLFLLVVYSMTTMGIFMTLINSMCSQCINFACPLNHVDDSVRDQFFDRNRLVADAWGKSGNRPHV